jgi:hypothetical protein
MPLDEDEKTTICTLLTRSARAFHQRSADEALVEHLQARIRETITQQANLRAAYLLFGFDVNVEGQWQAIKDALGEVRYSDALAKGNPSFQNEKAQPVITDVNADADADDGDLDADTIANFVASLDVTPRVRDAVLDQLKQAGVVGRKASSIREYFERTYSRNLHSKTVGMTLYRLLKEGLVRREGRTWFIVDETMNPGAGTPGLEDLVG